MMRAGADGAGESESLGTGAIVHANVRARLLGVRLLRIEADIVLAPATPSVAAARLGDARVLLARAERLLGPTDAR
ncbi:hypothetical protein [Nocardioides sp. SR21]|uniref:hypothetical protein n=1 Tax=Nocardioides sp. SR21 TaxID=2919501 RepID=UPI001FA9FF2E|nr:hypothetical protein [Nocardioides sp. SR21]